MKHLPVQVKRVRQRQRGKAWTAYLEFPDGTVREKGLGRWKDQYTAVQKAGELAERLSRDYEHVRGRGWIQRQLDRSLLDHAEDFLSIKAAEGLHRYTLTGYRCRLREVCEDLGWSTVDDVNLPEYRRWRIENPRGWKPATLNNGLCAFRSLFTHLILEGVTTTNPLEPLPMLYVPESNGANAPYEPDEAARLIAQSPAPRGLVYFLLTVTGIRKNEARSLRVRDLRLDGDIPHLIVSRDSAKNNHQRECVLVFPALVDALAEHVAGRAGTDPVFPSFPKDATLRRDMERAGIPSHRDDGRPLLWHSFRKLSGDLAVASGMAQRDVQGHLGHRDPRMTALIYTRSRLAPRHEAMQRLAPVLGQESVVMPDALHQTPHLAAETGGNGRQPVFGSVSSKPVVNTAASVNSGKMWKRTEGCTTAGQKWGRRDSNPGPAD